MQQDGPVERIPERFPDQRLTILPRQALLRAARHPVIGTLYPSRLGFFRKRPGTTAPVATRSKTIY